METTSPPIMLEATVLDTLETHINSKSLRMSWLNDTIQVILQNEKLVVNPKVAEALRASDNDSTILTKKEDIDEHLNSMKMWGQNCYSYALEHYFEHNPLFQQDLFHSSSEIDGKSAQKIISNYFKQIDIIATKPKSNLKKSLPDDVLLAFYNTYGSLTHFVYYVNGIFYSKNGAHTPIEFNSLKKFLKKHYWDTEKITVHTIDSDKVKSVYAHATYKK